MNKIWLRNVVKLGKYIALQSFQILYMFVLYVRKLLPFSVLKW